MKRVVNVIMVGVMISVIYTTYAHAEFFTCGNAQRLWGVSFSDPSNVPSCPSMIDGVNTGFIWHMFGKESMQKIHTMQGLLNSVPKKYLKVIESGSERGVIVEKSDVEKSSVDSILNQQAANAAALQSEKTNNTLCNTFDVDTIKARITTFRTNVNSANEAQSRTLLVNALEQIALCLATK